MEAASRLVRPRDVLIVGAFVVGWSVGRALEAVPNADHVAGVAEAPDLVAAPLPVAPSVPRERFGRRGRLVCVGIAAALTLMVAGVATRPDVAAAPRILPAVAAHERAVAAARAELARITLVRHLQLAGIAARRNGLPAPPQPQVTAKAQPVVRPTDRAIALDAYVQAVGADTILRGLDASRDQLQQQVLHDPRVHIYPGGLGDVTSGKLDVRVLAIIEYLAQVNGEVSVSCLIAGHSLYVAGRPGVVSAHIYGRAVDISAVGNVSILGHQGPGTVTEAAIRQILALPPSVEPLQVISLMTLGGPSFALPDHYNHIHIGY